MKQFITFHSCFFLILGTSRFKTFTRSIRKSLPGIRQKVHCESKNDSRTKNARSTLSTNVSVSRTFSRVYFTSKFSSELLRFSKFNPSLVFPFKVTVWGDYGRIEGKKVFMGVAQIMLDNLNLSHIVIGWYKLFGTTSLVPSSHTPSIGLSRRSSIASLDSLKL